MKGIWRITILAVLFGVAAPYNLESRLPLFKYGPAGSNFGYSVVIHKRADEPLVSLNEMLLVAGAPTASSTSSQPGASNTGGIYYCPVSTYTKDCSRVDMDAGGDVNPTKSIKTDQWLGVSLESQGPGGLLMTCAHRWRTQSGSGQDEREQMCGKCFLLNATSSNSIEEVPKSVTDNLYGGFVDSPCNKLDERIGTKNKYGYSQSGTGLVFGEHEYLYASACDLLEVEESDFTSKWAYAYSQAGSSISFNKEQYSLGAPGTWQWTGAVFDITMSEVASGSFEALAGLSQMFQTTACRERNFNSRSVYCNSLPLSRDSYMGLSVAQSNKIAKDSDEMYYAAGAPRGNYTGVVLFFTKQTNSVGETSLLMDYDQRVKGDGISSSFGYAIELTDLNGDGLDDLIVGAPQYYQYTNEGKYGGAIYIYFNHPDRGFRYVGPQRIYGPLDSWFGHSIAALGDIDQDGFNDFAVGAPYENGNGTVHIFRGSADKRVRESQVITANDFDFVPNTGNGDVEGFGASLSGVIDVDSNKYPDLLIGSLSDHIALIRTRPVIAVEMSFEATPLMLDLSQTSCAFGGEGACFRVKFCFTYTARHEEYDENVPISYKLFLDSERQKLSKTSRVHITTATGDFNMLEANINLPKAGQKFCPNDGFTVYFNQNVKDKLAPIGLEFEFGLNNQPINREIPGDEIFPMIQDPILDADFDTQASASVVIANNCGDNGCQSDLQISAEMPKEITVGVEDEIVVKIDVSNPGEEAHQAFTSIRIPSSVSFNNHTVSEGSNVACYTEQSTGQSTTILCALGNPYLNGSMDYINLHLGISKLDAVVKELNVEIVASTTSENPEIVPVLLKADVNVAYNITIIGRGRPEQVRYSRDIIKGESAMKYANEIGPLLQYTFTIKNEGRQPASELILSLELPYEIFNGKWLLYLLSAEITSGGSFLAGKCSNMYVNELELTPPIRLGSSTGAGRKKRAVQLSTAQVAQASTSGGSYSSLLKLSCDKRAKCVPVKCNLDEIQPGTTLSAVFQMYLWEATFLEEFPDMDLVSIKTVGSLKSDEKNIILKGKTSATILTTVDHDDWEEDAKAAFPWWYILIGVILTLLIYIIILVLLIKCGFFKRKKYPRQEFDEHENEVVEEEDEKKRDSDKM